VLAAEASAGRRTWVGLLGFIALEAAVFVRYTDIVVLGCAVVVVVAAAYWGNGWRRPARLPAAALGWWLGSVAVSGAGVAVFNAVVYGGPLKSAYPPGEITFSLGAILPNLRYVPVHLISAMPMLVLGLAALAWIAWRRVRPAGADAARRDFAVALALAASWFSVWGLYAAYTWTAGPGLSTLQAARFYVPALGAISLLGAWLVARLAGNLPRHVPRRASLAVMTSAAVVAATFGLGVWSFNSMRAFRLVEHTASSGVRAKSGGGAQRAGSGSQGTQGTQGTQGPAQRTGGQPAPSSRTTGP
jgi:hypothetical protein